MTVLVGILCSDGVVVASDSAATMAAGRMPTIGQQSTRKVYKLADSRIIYAGTGAVGMAQLIADRLDRGYRSGEFKGAATPEQMMGMLGAAITQMVMPYLQSGGMVHGMGHSGDGSLCKSLVAIDVKGTPCLFSFDFNGAPERMTAHLPFISMGSGQPIADPFLAFLKRLIWAKDAPTLVEGKLVSVWTIDHVCKTNPGGVGGDVQIMVLPKGGAVIELADGECAEHKQQAAGAESALVKYLKPDSAGAPAMPQPPKT
jgi:20S proteasome alpha/beta subunit